MLDNTLIHLPAINVAFTGWDIILILAVGVHGTAIAYVPSPRWKAFMITLPVPFTLATMAVGHPVNATNMAGLALLLGFYVLIRLLHVRLGVPAVPAIAVASVAFAATGAALFPIIPTHDAAFGIVTVAVLSLAVILMRTMPHRVEPPHVTPLPVWIKAPSILGVIIGLLLIKSHLGGFMTVFPMVGVISAYEARHSLWTMVRQVPVVMITLGALIVTVRLTQDFVGIPIGLLIGWVVFLALVTVITRRRWAAENALANTAA